MAQQRALTIVDIPWLRRASQKSGALLVPRGIADRLLAGGLVEQLDTTRDCLTITRRGQLALTKLG
jgi:hypothetical protein